jgi:exodeoxyribonuclease VII small subunit
LTAPTARSNVRAFQAERCRMAKKPAAKSKQNEEIELAQLEQSLEDLEQLVEKLESGDLSLEQALAEFERGIKLTRQCQSALKEAEQKVEILLKNTADAEPEPFEPDEDA